MTIAKPSPDELRAAARALYETTPDIKFPDIAAQIGAPVEEVRAWWREDGENGDSWQIARSWTTAPAAASRKAAELEPLLSETHAAAEAEARAALNIPESTDVTVIDDPHKELRRRHQQEWLGPRTLAYQAMKLGQKGRVEEAFTLAKLAKISAETLTIVQAGEGRAHGMKSQEGEGAIVVYRNNSQ